MVGAKAARLAVARQSGLPVLAGFVVTAPASRPHLGLGAETLETRGSGGARLAVSGRPIEQAPLLVEAGRRLAPALVARSSTLLEDSGEWAGAFTSYVDIAPEDLPKAVTGCWASAFSVDALERQEAAEVAPGSFPMAVLVQPSLAPEWGGAAEAHPDEGTVVHGVAGSPAPLLQGWVTGETAHRSAEGNWEGSLASALGRDVLEEIHRALADAKALLGVNRCEWAVASGNVWLLQLDTVHQPEVIATPSVGGTLEVWLPVIRSLLDAPGPLGAELVLPWGMAGLPEADPVPNVGPSHLDEAIRLCGRLTGQVWDRDEETAMRAARACLDGLLGPEPERSLVTVNSLASPDPGLAARLMGLVQGLRHTAEALAAVPSAATAWYLTTGEMRAALSGDRSPGHLRVGPGKWEPLVAAVVLTHGTLQRGLSASPGLGAGRLEVVDPDQPIKSPRPRSIVYAPQAVPVLSQILWDSSGVVTAAGSPAAHLFESARSLGVAAVTAVELPAREGSIVAVDGFAGTAAIVEE